MLKLQLIRDIIRMKILMYSKTDYCPFCEKAKFLINAITWDKVDLTELKIGRDIAREEFLTNFPEFKTVPQIYVDGTLIGGYDKFEPWFKAEKAKHVAED